MHILAKKLAQWLLKTGAIEENEKELYEYAVFSFLFSLFPLCLVMIIGRALGMFVEGILMIVPFILIRKFSGGYHLNSSVVCFVSSILLLSASLALISMVLSTDSYKIFFCVVFLAALQIFERSPIDSKARELNEKEKTLFRKIARLMVGAVLAFSLLLYAIGAEKFAIPIGMGIIITALLQLPCAFKEKQKNAP